MASPTRWQHHSKTDVINTSIVLRKVFPAPKTSPSSDIRKAEVKRHSFSASLLDVGKQSASRFGRFPPDTFQTGGWASSTANVNVDSPYKISFSLLVIKPHFFQPVVRHLIPADPCYSISLTVLCNEMSRTYSVHKQKEPEITLLFV